MSGRQKTSKIAHRKVDRAISGVRKRFFTLAGNAEPVDVENNR